MGNDNCCARRSGPPDSPTDSAATFTRLHTEQHDDDRTGTTDEVGGRPTMHSSSSLKKEREAIKKHRNVFDMMVGKTIVYVGAHDYHHDATIDLQLDDGSVVELAPASELSWLESGELDWSFSCDDDTEDAMAEDISDLAGFGPLKTVNCRVGGHGGLEVVMTTTTGAVRVLSGHSGEPDYYGKVDWEPGDPVDYSSIRFGDVMLSAAATETRIFSIAETE